MTRIGDHDRDRAAALLKRHFVRGRLSVEELGERLELALSARGDRDLRAAFADLPPAWREQVAAARSGVDGTLRAARRLAFVVAMWALWWAASIVLLVGFVTTVVVSGVSWTNAAAFAALWLVSTVAVKTVTRPRGVRR